MKIVFLVASYMPHQIALINAIIKQYNVEIHSFSISKNFSFIPNNSKGLITYEPSNYNVIQLYRKILEINPKLIVVAGWFIKDFVGVAKKINKTLNIPVVSYSDTQWRNNWKQKLNCLISPWHLKKAFSHIWVAGIYQYEYARKLRFEKNQIIYNSLSCDIKLFQNVSFEQKTSDYPKNFLFIGRFVPVKGLHLLMDAWQQISDKKGWTLTLVGDGPLKTHYQNEESVIVKNFMPQTQLIKEIQQSGCFILPSVFEPWALVIHEAAAAGLPIIATDVCGATPHFVINGFNGYQVKPNVTSIKNALESFIMLDTKQLIRFSQNSLKLAESITPELGAAQLMSILNKA
ncbi:glycosyltransferase family 4 protein [Gaetbulibacter aquiaggeris]|uniref:Glycosyltransferase family 4 protein n=1 Tax=Gaetbulibacter aquiaggeris TaxID=1735373 RepID=A0ABW7MSC8_9FLAO